MPRGVYKRNKSHKKKEPDLKKLILKKAKHHRHLSTHLYKLARSL